MGVLNVSAKVFMLLVRRGQGLAKPNEIKAHLESEQISNYFFCSLICLETESWPAGVFLSNSDPAAMGSPALQKYTFVRSSFKGDVLKNGLNYVCFLAE